MSCWFDNPYLEDDYKKMCLKEFPDVKKSTYCNSCLNVDEVTPADCPYCQVIFKTSPSFLRITKIGQEDLL
jgi:hypothetical protein